MDGSRAPRARDIADLRRAAASRSALALVITCAGWADRSMGRRDGVGASGVAIPDAVVMLRAYAFAEDRPISDVATAIVAGELRLDGHAA